MTVNKLEKSTTAILVQTNLAAVLWKAFPNLPWIFSSTTVERMLVKRQRSSEERNGVHLNPICTFLGSTWPNTCSSKGAGHAQWAGSVLGVQLGSLLLYCGAPRHPPPVRGWARGARAQPPTPWCWAWSSPGSPRGHSAGVGRPGAPAERGGGAGVEEPRQGPGLTAGSQGFARSHTRFQAQGGLAAEPRRPASWAGDGKPGKQAAGVRAGERLLPGQVARAARMAQDRATGHLHHLPPVAPRPGFPAWQPPGKAGRRVWSGARRGLGAGAAPAAP